MLRPHLTCADCYEIFSNEFELLAHQLNKCTPNSTISFEKVRHADETDDSTSCLECGEVFSNQRYLRRHKLLYCQSSRAIRCNVCEDECESLDALEHHKKYRCLGPSESQFTESNKLADAEKHECSFCGWKYTYRHNLLRHQRNSCTAAMPLRSAVQTDGVRRKFVCTNCSSSFANSSNLYRHQKNNCAFRTTK